MMGNKETEIFAGSKQMQITDQQRGISFPVLIHYPTHQPSAPTAFGPYTMDVSADAAIVDGKFPLVVISHGNGGSHLLYRTISIHLAKHGYIVAMLEHYGNNRNDNHLENTNQNLINRPRHISLTIDALLTENLFGNSIASNKIAVIGHSMGGYAALALAGGVPRTMEGEIVETFVDHRIKAIVLLAPGAGWFLKGLDNVTIPILMFTAEHDSITPKQYDIVFNSIADKSLVIHRVVKNAGHFSFLSPFPLAMKNPNFLPSTDPEGFDREALHKQLPQEILNFLEEKLK